MAAIIAAAIAGTAAIAGGAMSANASKKAGDTAANATKTTNGLNKYIYDTSRADQEPWRVAGANALGRISDPSKVMGNFQASPDYAFRMQQGLAGVTQNRAVNGLLQSGSALKGLNNYAQNTASGEFGDWWNRQAGLAGVGQAANAANQQAGQNYANSATQANQWNASNQMASSYGQANAWSQTAGQVAGIAANTFANWNTPSPNYANVNSINGIRG